MSKLTKERARAILQLRTDMLSGFTWPIHDKVVFIDTENANEIHQYTFRGLLCVAYDLEEKPNV